MCRAVFWIFVCLYGLALLLWLVGSFGLFGSPKGPMAGVFVVILGQPWVRLVDLLPGWLWPWAAALTPALNAVIIRGLCSRFGGR